MFNITYSVNDLVNTASDKKINDFIFSTMFNNKSIRTYSNMIKKVKYSDLELSLIHILCHIWKVVLQELFQDVTIKM